MNKVGGNYSFCYCIMDLRSIPIGGETDERHKKNDYSDR